jgi:2'-5' RNA ligase
MRIFVALFPPEELRRSLLESAQELEVSGRVRWVRPEGVHLTLKFLGETPEEAVEGLQQALSEVCARHGPFEVGLSGFGAFPSRRKARVIWSGVDAGADSLRALAEDVERSLEKLGFGRERRPYSPHLTLGRAGGRPVTLGPEERDPEVKDRFMARRIDLVESVLDRKGATYTTLAAYGLSEGGE